MADFIYYQKKKNSRNRREAECIFLHCPEKYHYQKRRDPISQLKKAKKEERYRSSEALYSRQTKLEAECFSTLDNFYHKIKWNV